MRGNIPAQNDWEVKRLGKFTSSKISCLLSDPRSKADKEAGKLSEGARTYILENITEIATGTTRQISTYATEWGNEYEPVAAYKIKEAYPDFEYMGKDSPQFFEYTDFSGGSPDGYSESAKMVAEIKCPENPAKHTAYVLMCTQEDLKKSEPEYYAQIQFNMMCVAKKIGCEFKEMTGLFVSYCPMFEGKFEHQQFKMLSVSPDLEFEENIKERLKRAEKILAEVYHTMTSTSNTIIISKEEGVVIAQGG